MTSSSFLNGTTPINALFSSFSSFSYKEPFSIFSSTDASGNPTTDASGNSSSGLFGSMGNMFSSSSSSSDASGNPTTTTDASGNPATTTGSGIFGSMGSIGSMFSSSTAATTDASGNPIPAATATAAPTTDAAGNPITPDTNTNPSITTYTAFFQSLFYLFVQICIIGYLGASFLCLVKMSKKELTEYMPSDINWYPYCSPDGTQEFGVKEDPIYSYGFPYNLYCDANDDEKCVKTCKVIKSELRDPDAFVEYTPFAFWLSLSMKNTYATFRAFIKMICMKMGNLLSQDKYDTYGILENVMMFSGLILMYIVILYGGFIGFFMTYVFQFYNSGFIMSGFAWTLGLFLLSWIPPFFNFFGFIFQALILFLWIPFTQNTNYPPPNENKNTKVVFEIFKRKKTLLVLLFSIGMIMNAFKYLTAYEPYYVLTAVAMFLFNMYANSSKDMSPS